MEKRLYGLLMCFWIIGWGSLDAEPLRSAESVWEVSPYRVWLLVAVEPAPLWPENLADILAQELTTRCQNYIGAVWDIRAEKVSAGLAGKMLANLEGLRVEDLPPGWQEEDKLLLLAVRSTGQLCQLEAREWDARTQLFGTTVRAEVVQPAKVVQVALETLVKAFCPLARIDRPHQGRAKLRPRAIGLPQPPGAPQWIRSGTVFRPVLRKSDRQGKPISIKPVPWTYLVVKQVSKQAVECQVYSGLSAPLVERRRGRIEMLGLVVLPPQRPSVLTLADRQLPHEPLVGYDVFCYTPAEPELQSLGQTDLRGKIKVPPCGEGLLILLVVSGGTPMVRFPLIPGVQEEVEVLLAKDTPRLRAEVFLRSLQETLLDLVAQREILLARIQHRLEKGQKEEAIKLFEQFQALHRQQEALVFQVQQREKDLVCSDPEVRSKIEAIWKQAGQLLAQQADDHLLEKLATQLYSAKSPADQPAQPSAPNR